MRRADIDWLHLTEHVKDQVPGNVFGGGTFSDFFQQNLSLHLYYKNILQSTSCQIWDFCLLNEVIYWPCDLKFVYPTMNLTFLGMIIVELNFLRNFAFTVLNYFVSKKVVMPNIFSLLSEALWLGINSCYSIPFSKKEHNIISSRVISSHRGPMYIETPCI